MGRAKAAAMMRKLGLLLLPALVALLIASCDDGGGNGDGNGNGLSPPNDTDGRTRIEFWHSMSSFNDAALNRLVNAFNQSQTEYRVEAINQGSYTDSLNKLIASIPSGDIPVLFQSNDVSTQIMIDSQEIMPLQDFIDDEDYDLSDFDPKPLAYYTAGETLYAMPFNLSGPILIYDRDAFREAGLDADRAPRTLDEVKAAAEALVRRDAQGNVTRYGIALQISPWLFEQMLAKQNALYVNNGNGREGRATEAVFDSEAGVRILAWWQEMVDSGLAYNAGTADLNALLKLASGEASMAIGSTAILGGAAALLSIAGGAGDRFGSGPLPAPEGDGGIVVGGGALWIMERRPEEEQRGAWEFIKFASRPEQQAQWHADTGYFPTRLSANDLPPAVQRREQFPQFTTAMDQLHASPDTVATRGALVGRFDAVRDRITRAFEQVLSGGADPAQELQAAADDATEIIEEYNKTAPD